MWCDKQEGKMVVPLVLDDAGEASEGIISATIDGKSGYLKLK